MNEYTDACRRHAQVGAKMKHNNQEIAAWAIRSQLRGVKFTKPVEITYTFFEPNRRRDKSNVAAFGIKVIEDALAMCGLLKDDGWQSGRRRLKRPGRCARQQHLEARAAGRGAALDREPRSAR